MVKTITWTGTVTLHSVRNRVDKAVASLHLSGTSDLSRIGDLRLPSPAERVNAQVRDVFEESGHSVPKRLLSTFKCGQPCVQPPREVWITLWTTLCTIASCTSETCVSHDLTEGVEEVGTQLPRL